MTAECFFRTNTFSVLRRRNRRIGCFWVEKTWGLEKRTRIEREGGQTLSKLSQKRTEGAFCRTQFLTKKKRILGGWLDNRETVMKRKRFRKATTR